MMIAIQHTVFMSHMCGFLGAAIVNKWYLCVYADGSDMYVL